MTLDESYYEILDIGPDASAQQVHAAYLRAKSAYNKDSIALYSLVGPEEREEALQQIEKAYQILSNELRRQEYDRCHGILSPLEDVSGDTSKDMPKVISIDRVPPMEVLDGEDLLIAPATDFAGLEPDVGKIQEPQQSAAAATDSEQTDTSRELEFPPGIADEIAHEIEWRGSLLRKIRESQKLSIEEISATTKISRTYLQCIEEENFKKLPAAVFLRGFVTQVAKVLKLPHDKVAGAYLARYFQARPDQKL